MSEVSGKLISNTFKVPSHVHMNTEGPFSASTNAKRTSKNVSEVSGILCLGHRRQQLDRLIQRLQLVMGVLLVRLGIEVTAELLAEFA